MKGTRKTFRPYALEQILLLPPDLSEWVPAGHLARLVDDVVENTLDLGPIYSKYTEVRGAPPYDPLWAARSAGSALLHLHCISGRGACGKIYLLSQNSRPWP